MPLSQQPLALVLGQVRFSPIRQMDKYIPEIQEAFRQHGFPVERAGKVQQVTLGPSAGGPVQVIEQQRWEYRTREETCSVLLTEDRLHVESTGRTQVGDDVRGNMIVRIAQDDQGLSLPPDLVGGAPKYSPRAKRGELITLIDMDHYIEGAFDADTDWVVARAFEMHDHLVETFHNHVVTETAIEVWK